MARREGNGCRFRGGKPTTIARSATPHPIREPSVATATPIALASPPPEPQPHAARTATVTHVQNLVAKALAVHQAIYEHSHGWIGHRLVFGMPTLLLHSVGRKTGKPRTVALTYGRDGDRYLVTASNGGSPRPPGWLANLTAHPDCEIQIGRTHRRVRARKVLPKDDDYERYWDIVNHVNRGQYREYQKRTRREIAIVELTPRA